MDRSTLIIISPDASLITSLKQGVSSADGAGRVVIVRRYPTAQQLDELIANRKPTSVIVGLSGPDAALGLIAHLQAQHPQVFVATAHTTDLSDLILAGIRAGAKEYVGPPFSGTALERVLRPQKPRESVGRRGGRLICFMPARGGCGGSTVAVHMATALARESKERVLFVDFDFHAGTVDLCLGLRTEFTLADAVRRRSDLDELWAQLTHRWNDCSVLAAPPSGHSIEAEILRETPSVFESARRAYDWVVCDLPAAVYTSSVRVLEQAEVVYLVSTPELNSLKLARRKARELFDLGIPEEAIRLIANRVGEASPLSETEMGKIVGIPVAWGFPNDYEGVNKAILKQRLVSETSKLGKQFTSFTRDLLGLEVETEEPASLKNLFSRLKADRFGLSRSAREQESPAENPVSIPSPE